MMRSFLYLIFLAISFNAKADIKEFKSFGSNPGNLKAYSYTSQTNSKKPLVVLLHGCAQDAKTYATKSGWLKIAKENKFDLLMPEQKEENNQASCFTWYLKGDYSKNKGESKSIKQIIDTYLANNNIDQNKVYITGLSAGAIMANIMIANYPGTFKAGSIVAGVPYGCAIDVTTAFMCMYGYEFPPQTPAERSRAVRRINPDFNDDYPSIQIFHGTGDTVVYYPNAVKLVDQWSLILRITTRSEETIEYEEHSITEYGAGKKLSLYSIFNLDHGQPVSPANGCGKTGKYFLESAICASQEAAKFFDLIK